MPLKCGPGRNGNRGYWDELFGHSEQLDYIGEVNEMTEILSKDGWPEYSDKPEDVEVEPHDLDPDEINQELLAIATKHGISAWVFVAETKTDTTTSTTNWQMCSFNTAIGMLVRTLDKLRGIGQ